PVSRVLDVAGDPRDRVVPGNVLPMIGARSADLRGKQAIRIVDVIPEGGSLGTEWAAVDRMMATPLDMNDGGGRVFPLVAQRANDHSAGHRAVGAGTSGLRGARDLELAHLRFGRRDVEAESDRGSDAGGLQEPATRDLHR